MDISAAQVDYHDYGQCGGGTFPLLYSVEGQEVQYAQHGGYGNCDSLAA